LISSARDTDMLRGCNTSWCGWRVLMWPLRQYSVLERWRNLEWPHTLPCTAPCTSYLTSGRMCSHMLSHIMDRCGARLTINTCFFLGPHAPRGWSGRTDHYCIQLFILLRLGKNAIMGFVPVKVT
jgi:hypothetical protein